MNIEDKKLIQDYLNGSNLAFEQLIDKYLAPIYNFLRQFVGDKDNAKDLTQETFYKVWKNLSKIDEDKNFKAWIFVIAKNTALDYLKKHKCRPFSFFEDDNGNNWIEETIKEECLLPNETMEQKDLEHEINKKIKKIPHQYRIILFLRYKEDFSLREIAKMLKKPYNTVRSTHRRALLRLRKEFLEDSASLSDS